MNNSSQLLIYQTSSGNISIDIRLELETGWLTQDHMADLFRKSKSTINEHIKNIFTKGELLGANVMKKFGVPNFSKKHRISTIWT